MFKKLNLLTIILLVMFQMAWFGMSTTAFAESVDTAWVRTYAGPGGADDDASAIATDSFGNVYVTGTSNDSWTNYDYVTIKYNLNGSQVWAKRYNGPGNSADWASNVAVDESGNVYVTGYSYGGGAYGYFATIKYNSNGDTLWVRRYNGPENFESGPAMVIDNSQNVYVTGFSYDSGTKDDYATIKYNTNGDTLWVRRYNGPAGSSMDGASAIAIDRSGNVYVTGYSWGGVTMGDYATIKYYSNGDTAWVRRYDGLANNQDHARDIAVDSSGNVYVTGYGSGNYFTEYITVKYYSNGDTAWVRRYKNTGSDLAEGYALTVDDSGNAYITGCSFGSGTSFDYATMKYNSNGDTLWVSRYNGPASGFDSPSAIVLDGSGNVYVTGYGTSSNGTDWATIKYDSNGDSVWVTIYNGPGNGNDQASSIVADGSGNVYVTGGSVGSGGYYSDFCTIKYFQMPSDIKDKTDDRGRPSEFYLRQNYPNPFNPTTNIEFTLVNSGFVILQIYDVLGRQVRTLVSENLPSGYKSVIWDGKNDQGEQLASGIYFYELKVGENTSSKKMVLLK